MPNSQNGWPVVPRSAVDEAPLIRDVRVPNGMLAGDVALIFRWLAREYDRRVEPIDEGECWGWHVKVIEGSDVISNHASGTAIDINAPDNPMGSGTTRKSMTEEQIAECHAIERESGGVLRWGGDFGRNDPMHWEIDKGEDAVAEFATQIREEEDDMPTADVTRQIIREELQAFGQRDPLATILVRSKEQQGRMAVVMQKVDDLDDDDLTDDELTALAAKLGEKLSGDQAKRFADELHARLAS